MNKALGAGLRAEGQCRCGIAGRRGGFGREGVRRVEEWGVCVGGRGGCSVS